MMDATRANGEDEIIVTVGWSSSVMISNIIKRGCWPQFSFLSCCMNTALYWNSKVVDYDEWQMSAFELIDSGPKLVTLYS
jgi:hypothetical protein